MIGPVPLELGPTRFCPCTQNRTDLRDPIARTVRRYFGGEQHCTELEDLSWMLHAGNARRAGPWITLYDADVYHQGLENVASEDRPVLVVALAASSASAYQRGYIKRNISQAQKVAVGRFRSVDLAPL